MNCPRHPTMVDCPNTRAYEWDSSTRPAPGQVPGLGSMISWDMDRDIILGGRERRYTPLSGLGAVGDLDMKQIAIFVAVVYLAWKYLS